MVHAIQQKSRIDEISHMDGIYQTRVPTGEKGCNPCLYDIMAPLDADDVVPVLPDDPGDPAKGTYSSQAGLFNREHLHRKAFEH